MIHLYISLSGLISFLIVKNFANKSHPIEHLWIINEIELAISTFARGFSSLNIEKICQDRMSGCLVKGVRKNQSIFQLAKQT